MTRFTRLTLVGSVRRADVVVPSDEEIAVLVPRPPRPRRRTSRHRGGRPRATHRRAARRHPRRRGPRPRRRRDPSHRPHPGRAAARRGRRRHRGGLRHARRPRRPLGRALPPHHRRRRRRAARRAPPVSSAPASSTGERPALVLCVVVVLLLFVAATVTARAGWIGLAAGSAAAGLAPATALAVGPVLPDSSIGVAVPLALAVGWAALAATSGSPGATAGRSSGGPRASSLSLLWLGLGSVATWPTVRVGRRARRRRGRAARCAARGSPSRRSGVHRLDDAALEGVEPARGRRRALAPRRLPGPHLEHRRGRPSRVVLRVPVLLGSGSRRWARLLGAGVLLVAALRTRPLPLAPQAAVAVGAGRGPGVVLGSRPRCWRADPARRGVVLGALAAWSWRSSPSRPNAQQRARLRRAGATCSSCSPCSSSSRRCSACSGLPRCCSRSF